MTAEGAVELGAEFAAIDPWARHGFTAKTLADHLGADEPAAPRYEIMAEETRAGAMCIRKTWLRGPYLQFLGVLPRFQNRGLGTAALGWFEAEALRTNSDNIWIAASDFNTGALTLYERFGFVRVASLDGLVSEGTTEILLRKRLIIR